MKKKYSYQDTLGELKTYSKLEPNWDSYDGLPPTKQSVEIASQILGEIHSKNPDLKLTHISPISSGVYLLWRITDLELEIEIDDESMLYYEYSTKDEKVMYKLECFYDENLEDNISKTIERILEQNC